MRGCGRNIGVGDIVQGKYAGLRGSIGVGDIVRGSINGLSAKEEGAETSGKRGV